MRLVVAFLLALASTASAEPPTRPLATFDSAKKVARNAIYADHRTEFYWLRFCAEPYTLWWNDQSEALRLCASEE